MNNGGLLEQAERLQRAGNFPEAARAYSQLLRQEPESCTVRFTRDLDRAHAVMWQRHQSGDPPSSFAVEKEHD